MQRPVDPAAMKTGRHTLLTVPLDAHVVSALAAVFALVVFAIDELTPFDIAIAVFYVVVVLLVASTGNRSSTIKAAWGCVVLTLFRFRVISRRRLLERRDCALHGEPAGGRDQIAAEMNLSVITVKIHRGQAMRKMCARSLADFVLKAEALGIKPPQGMTTQARNSHA